jgi:hypothetical protein
MSWIGIVIVILVLGMMVGPMMLLKPSTRDKSTANLRAKAMSLKLKVHLQKWQTEMLAAYELPWQMPNSTSDWALDRKNYHHEIHLAQVWQWRNQPPASVNLVKYLDQALNDLPMSAVALEASVTGLKILWRESGGEPELMKIYEWLMRAREQLSTL